MAVEAVAYRKPQKQDEGDKGFLGDAGKALGSIGSVAALIPGGQPVAAAAGALSAANSLSQKSPEAKGGNSGGAAVSTSGGAISRKLSDLDDQKAKKLAGLA